MAVLAALTIRDIVLIEQAALEFAPGLNVLTGETGAGKSILLDSLGLAVGGPTGSKGRASVRAGAAQGSATAVFEPEKSHAAWAMLRDQAMEGRRSEIVLRRTLASDGRSRAFINDEAVGVGLLKDLGSLLLEVHGQQDDRGLFDTATHRALLDGFGGLNGDAQTVAALFAEWSAARAALEELKALAARAEAEADFVRAAASELSDFAPEAGEEESLAGERALMMNAARIVEEVSSALESLSGERGAETGLAQALKKLSRMNEEARKIAAPAETALEQAYALAEEARRELDLPAVAAGQRHRRAGERKEERLFALRALARKYGVTPDQLARHARRFSRQAGSADGGRQPDQTGAKPKSPPRARPISPPRANCRKRAKAPPASWKPPWPANWRR